LIIDLSFNYLIEFVIILAFNINVIYILDLYDYFFFIGFSMPEALFVEVYWVIFVVPWLFGSTYSSLFLLCLFSVHHFIQFMFYSPFILHNSFTFSLVFDKTTLPAFTYDYLLLILLH
jgi:hypothetical protein